MDEDNYDEQRLRSGQNQNYGAYHHLRLRSFRKQKTERCTRILLKLFLEENFA